MIYYQVYMIQNKINGKVYIGKHTVDTFKTDNYFGSSEILKKAILKYGLENFTPRIELEAFENEDDAYWYEHRYVTFYKENGIPLYNIASGGKGGSKGLKHSNEHKRKIKESIKEKYNLDDDYKQKRNKVMCSENYKNNMSKIKMGHITTDETKRKLSKKVKNLDTGDIYNSTIEVSKKYNVNRGRISECCNGKIKTVIGYHWKYVIEE